MDGAIKACTSGIEQLTLIIEKDKEHFEVRSKLTMLHGNRAMYGSEHVKQSIADWNSAVKYAVDDNTREYCRLGES